MPKDSKKPIRVLALDYDGSVGAWLCERCEQAASLDKNFELTNMKEIIMTTLDKWKNEKQPKKSSFYLALFLFQTKTYLDALEKCLEKDSNKHGLANLRKEFKRFLGINEDTNETTVIVNASARQTPRMDAHNYQKNKNGSVLVTEIMGQFLLEKKSNDEAIVIKMINRAENSQSLQFWYKKIKDFSSTTNISEDNHDNIYDKHATEAQQDSQNSNSIVDEQKISHSSQAKNKDTILQAKVDTICKHYLSSDTALEDLGSSLAKEKGPLLLCIASKISQEYPNAKEINIEFFDDRNDILARTALTLLQCDGTIKKNVHFKLNHLSSIDRREKPMDRKYIRPLLNNLRISGSGTENNPTGTVLNNHKGYLRLLAKEKLVTKIMGSLKNSAKKSPESQEFLAGNHAKIKTMVRQKILEGNIEQHKEIRETFYSTRLQTIKEVLSCYSEQYPYEKRKRNGCKFFLFHSASRTIIRDIDRWVAKIAPNESKQSPLKQTYDEACGKLDNLIEHLSDNSRRLSKKVDFSSLGKKEDNKYPQNK